VWHGDELPAVDLGGGITQNAVSLDLALVQLGEGPCGPSWTARSQQLLKQWGPFRLAHMEALLRTADARGSAVRREEQA
jgi:CRISPR-associated endonuclease/helicase Cas3